MTYDNLDRLTQTTSVMFASASYAYDVLDNLTRATVGASAQVAARDHFYCYDATSRQLTFIRTSNCSGAAVTSLGYDPQGNVDYKNNADYVFDYGNRLRSAPGEWYAYDGHGRRVLSCTPAACDYQQYAANGQLSFHRDNRKGLDYVNLYLGGSLVAIREQPTAGGSALVKYQHTDALGTPIATTDGTGAFIEKSEYEPYGKLVNRPLTDGPGFTGHVQDAATGLTYMQQRYYDPGIGRFLSADPVIANSSTGANFNRYKYAANNPYRFIDPDGRQEKEGDREKADFRSTGSHPGLSGSSLSGVPESGGAQNMGRRWEGQIATSYPSGGVKGPVGDAISSFLDTQFEKRAFDRYWYGDGDYSLTEIEFRSLVAAAANLAPYDTQSFLKAGVTYFAEKFSFYGAGYAGSVGSGWLISDANGHKVGFYDQYDFNSKPWGARTFPDEIRTRMVDPIGAVFGAKPYNITYGTYIDLP